MRWTWSFQIQKMASVENRVSVTPPASAGEPVSRAHARTRARDTELVERVPISEGRCLVRTYVRTRVYMSGPPLRTIGERDRERE